MGDVREIPHLDDQVVVGIACVRLAGSDGTVDGFDRILVGPASGDTCDDQPVTCLSIEDDVAGFQVAVSTEPRLLTVFVDERLDATLGTVGPALVRWRDAVTGHFDGDASDMLASLVTDAVVRAGTATFGEVDDVRRAAVAVDGVPAPI